MNSETIGLLSSWLRRNRYIHALMALGLPLPLLRTAKAVAKGQETVLSPKSTILAINQDATSSTLMSLALTMLVYLLIAWSIYAFYNRPREEDLKLCSIIKKVIRGSSWARLNPAVVSAGEYGQASLSSLQLLWFTLIVVFLSCKSMISGFGLPHLSETVIALLGIPAAGKLAASFVSANRERLSLENWNYLITHKILISGNMIDPAGTAFWRDLVLTDGTFDPARFQLFCSSFLVGLAMLLGGDLAKFNPDHGGAAAFLSSWGVLLAGSNIIYIGGKAVAPSAIEDLNKRVTGMQKGDVSLFVNDNDAGKELSLDGMLVVNTLKSLYGKHVLCDPYRRDEV